ncbi:MAG: succinate dehydrogenase assembly factor 4 [Steroidobacter sp.]
MPVFIVLTRFRRFQAGCFLANYKAMCPSNEFVANPESKTLTVADTVLSQKQLAILQSPVKINTTEIGGRDGPEPTRYGDWEKAGRCIDF